MRATFLELRLIIKAVHKGYSDLCQEISKNHHSFLYHHCSISKYGLVSSWSDYEQFLWSKSLGALSILLEGHPQDLTLGGLLQRSQAAAAICKIRVTAHCSHTQAGFGENNIQEFWDTSHWSSWCTYPELPGAGWGSHEKGRNIPLKPSFGPALWHWIWSPDNH